MKFKRFKFITMIFIFAMLLGGILPASECLAEDEEGISIPFNDYAVRYFTNGPVYCYVCEVENYDSDGLIRFGSEAFFKNSTNENGQIEIVMALAEGYALERYDGSYDLCIKDNADETRYPLKDFTFFLKIPNMDDERSCL